MTDATLLQKKLQWKWIGIAFLLYLVLYLAPFSVIIALFAGPRTPTAVSFLVGWSVAGIFIVAAATSYWSKGRTLWEPFIAALVMIALIVLVLRPMFIPKELELHYISVEPSGTYDIALTILLLLLSFVGSSLGARIWKAQHPGTN